MNNEEAYAIGARALAAGFKWMPGCLAVSTREKWLDGTWHRPMTTLELAALQSLPVQRDDGAWLKLDGRSSAGWRERIGNAVPVATAEAIATTALTCLLSSDAGALTFSAEPIWVGPQKDEEATAC